MTREGARHAARSELSKHVYHRYDDPWPVALMKLVGRWLARTFDAVSRHAPGGGFGALALAALVVAMVLFARWRLGPLGRDARRTGAVFDERVLTAADHRRAAERAATAGDWRAAVVERMRAVARELEERAVLDPLPGRTADELARDAARELPTAAAALHVAAETFDATVYGDRPATAASYDRVRAADDAVRSARTPEPAL